MSHLKISMVFTLTILASHHAGAQSRTLAEATRLSKETGRPIFVMAGQET